VVGDMMESNAGHHFSDGEASAAVWVVEWVLVRVRVQHQGVRHDTVRYVTVRHSKIWLASFLFSVFLVARG
jgi:hypothetical protein